MDASIETVHNLSIIIQLVWLEGILSIDNAAVLAAIANTLPDNISPPRFFPRWLFGSQRQAALKAGILGAYLGRGIMLLFAGLLLKQKILRIAGSIWLV